MYIVVIMKVFSRGVGVLGYDTRETTHGGCVNLSRSYLDIQSCPCVAPRVVSSDAICKRWRIGFGVKGERWEARNDKTTAKCS